MNFFVRRHAARLLAFFVAAISLLGVASAQELARVLNLAGRWKFNLGDDASWSRPELRDSEWDEVSVPRAWEDEGYPGYDGYAWYRKHFTVQNDLRGTQLYLRVGYVDDASEVYLNGHLVGFEGSFPPEFTTAYNISRAYIVPETYLNFGRDNLLAVRVYDRRQVGGMTHGSVGLYESKEPLTPDLDLAGKWQFRTGDNPDWADPGATKKGWDEIAVPRYWETEGYRLYDGYAWYRREFNVPPSIAGRELVLLLGKIDDFDEAYVNGERIGRTGRMRENWNPKDWGDEYSKLRAYVVPSGLLVPGKVNVLAVRVLDVHMHGGIYDGPVGLIARRKYYDVQKDRGRRWDPFNWFR